MTRITISDRLAEGDVRHAQAASAPCDAHHRDEIRATRIGGHAHRYLLAARPDSDRAAGRPLTGHVVSTFRHGLNIVFDEGGSPTWVALHTPDAPLHPWAIEVPAAPLGADVGASVMCDGQAVALGLSLLRFRDARVDDLQIVPYTSEGAELALSRLPILMRFLIDANRCRPADPFQSEIDAVVARWRALDDPSVLVELVGLGSGSTPAGDDILVGILAGLAVSGRTLARAASQRATLSASLGSCGWKQRTAPASAQMVAAARDGAFPSPLLDLVNSLGEARSSSHDVVGALGAVTSLGASSGLSLVAGLVAAVRPAASPPSPGGAGR